MVAKNTAPRVTDGLEEIEPDAGERHMILAKVIEDISKAMKTLLGSGLNRRAIVVLLHDALPAGGYRNPKPGLSEIGKVLDALQDLERKFCR